MKLSKEKPKLFIVDDEKDICMLLKFALKDFYDIDYAHTITQAEQLIEDLQPEGFLVDLDLPDGSGFDLIQRLKEKTSDVGEHILIISAHAGKKEKQRAQELGVKYFIEKPLDMSELTQTVTSLI